MGTGKQEEQQRNKATKDKEEALQGTVVFFVAWLLCCSVLPWRQRKARKEGQGDPIDDGDGETRRTTKEQSNKGWGRCRSAVVFSVPWLLCCSVHLPGKRELHGCRWQNVTIIFLFRESGFDKRNPGVR